jgi:hypothetical protein
MAPQPKSQMDQLKEALQRAKRGKDRGYMKDPFAWPGPGDTGQPATDQISFEEITAPFTNFGNAVQVTRVRGPESFLALAYRCHLNVDNDGAPTCYAPPGSGLPHLDGLGSAKSSKTPPFRWVGFYALTPQQAGAFGLAIDQRAEVMDSAGRFPVLQRRGDPAPGYYVSTTSTPADPTRPLWDQRRYWDATQVRYGALSGGLKNQGVLMGDFGLVIDTTTGTSSQFFFADAGSVSGPSKDAVGENSTRVYWDFGGTNKGHVCFLVFPGSGNGNAGPGTQHLGILRVREQVKKLTQARNGDELALFLALGADLRRFEKVLRKLHDDDLMIPPVHEFETVMRALTGWGLPQTWIDTPPSIRLPTIGDFPAPGDMTGTPRMG